MKRMEKFANLRKKLKEDLRNPGCVDLDKEIAQMTTNKKMGQINKPLLSKKAKAALIAGAAFVNAVTYGLMPGCGLCHSLHGFNGAVTAGIMFGHNDQNHRPIVHIDNAAIVIESA